MWASVASWWLRETLLSDRVFFDCLAALSLEYGNQLDFQKLSRPNLEPTYLHTLDNKQTQTLKRSQTFKMLSQPSPATLARRQAMLEEFKELGCPLKPAAFDKLLRITQRRVLKKAETLGWVALSTEKL